MDVIEALQPASINMMSGRYKEAERIFREVCSHYPESSLAAHDYGVFLAEARNDYDAALPFFVKATTLEPRKALHFVQVVECIKRKALQEGGADAVIRQSERIRAYLMEAAKCPDFETLSQEDKDLVGYAVRGE